MSNANPDKAARAARAAADRAFDQLLERIGEANVQPRLDATRRAVELLGDPQDSASVITIAGTNGKTSTSRMIESLLRAKGLTTGLLTSPHLERVTERILLDGEPVSDAEFARNWSEVSPIIDLVDAELTAAGEAPLTYFEALTVLAFAIFADTPVDVQVLEVGMGGEWDSTNVADADVAVFTPIALDHVQRLGSTVGEIATTKSGIIKHGAIVVSAAQSPDALAALQARAEQEHAVLNLEGEAFAVERSVPAGDGQFVTMRGLGGQYSDVFVPLLGEYQAHNAALAVAAVEALFGGDETVLSDELVAEGLGAATSPGRMQTIADDPRVLVDAAHNPHGAEALATAIRELTDEPVVLVIGVLGDKDALGILDALLPLASEIVVTQSSSDRAIPAAELAETVELRVEDQPVDVIASADEAFAHAVDRAEALHGMVLVTGSITLVADAIAAARTAEWGRP